MARTKQMPRRAGPVVLQVPHPPLHEACRQGNLAQVQRLLSEQGYPTDNNTATAHPNGMTPFHFASLRGNVAVLQASMEHLVQHYPKTVVADAVNALDAHERCWKAPN